MQSKRIWTVRMSEGRPFEWPNLHIAEKSRFTWNAFVDGSPKGVSRGTTAPSPEYPFHVESHFAEMSPKPFHVEQLYLKLEYRFT
jgi:hypothetical protein